MYPKNIELILLNCKFQFSIPVPKHFVFLFPTVSIFSTTKCFDYYLLFLENPCMTFHVFLVRTEL